VEARPSSELLEKSLILGVGGSGLVGASISYFIF